MEISEDTKDIIKDMMQSEAWLTFESHLNEEVRNLRILATQRPTPLEDRLWYAAEAQGRENLLISFKDKIYERERNQIQGTGSSRS